MARRKSWKLFCLYAGRERHLDCHVRSTLPNSTFTYLIIARKSNSQAGKVIIKTAPQGRLENERNVLKYICNCPYIRQVLDETKDPPSLILQYLDDNLLHASSVKTLESSDVKFVAKRVLQAIQALHENGY